MGMIDEPIGWIDSWQLVEWALANFNIKKCKEELTDAEIKEVMRWIGMCAVDTTYFEGRAMKGRLGTGLMLTVTLLEFPEYYEKHELSQFN